MKVGDVHHSNNKTVSFNTQDLIREQLEHLTSMVYNMFIPKEENNRPCKPQIHQKKRRGQTNKMVEIGTEIDHSVDRGRQNFRPNYRRQSQDRHTQNGCDNRRGSYRHQHYGIRSDSRDRGRVNLEEASVMMEMIAEIGIGIEQEKGERSLTPRRNDRRYHSPNTNLGTKNRSNSRVTMNRYRIRHYKYRV